MDLMAFQKIDLNVRTAQELDFRLMTTSKNNCSKIYIAWPTPKILSTKCIPLRLY